MTQTTSTRLLLILYISQSELKSIVRAPFVISVRKMLDENPNMSFIKITKALLPFLKEDNSPEKLARLLDKKVTEIETRSRIPDDFIGRTLSQDELIKQLKISDVFSIIYMCFMLTIQKQKPHTFNKIQTDLLQKSLNINITNKERNLLKKLFSGETTHPPLTINITHIQELIDTLYESSCKFIGPTLADKILSDSISKANQSSPPFDAKIFL